MERCVTEKVASISNLLREASVSGFRKAQGGVSIYKSRSRINQSVR